MAQHIGQETSMEEILSSIKRVIQEGGDRAPRRGGAADAPLGRATPFGPPDGDEDEHEVLELTQAVDAAEPMADDGPIAGAPVVDEDDAAEWRRVTAEPAPTAPAAEARVVEEAGAESPALVSATTVEASRAALASLNRMVVKEAGQDVTLEAMVRDMLRPMLQQWLDANLPQLVERLVAAEVARIARDEN